MGKELPHKRVKLVIPILFSDNQKFDNAIKILVDNYGKIDYKSKIIDFNLTDYYNEEMGDKIYRIIISFENLIEPENLVEIKKNTNKIEKELSVDGKRKVNLDPAYLTLGKFILATTKDYNHRIYMGQGIYEEVTLFYRNKKWEHYDWTYPDYRTEIYKIELENIRKIYKEQLKKLI